MKVLALPGACPTRWWSTTTTVQAFVANERPIKMLCDPADDSLNRDNVPILEEDDWTVRAIFPCLTDNEEWVAKVLQPFKTHLGLVLMESKSCSIGPLFIIRGDGI